MADTQQARECPHIKACHEDECAGICKQPAPEGELQSWCPTEVAVAVLRREWYALTSERDALAAKAAENFAAAVEAQERADALAAKLEHANVVLRRVHDKASHATASLASGASAARMQHDALIDIEATTSAALAVEEVRATLAQEPAPAAHPASAPAEPQQASAAAIA